MTKIEPRIQASFDNQQFMTLLGAKLEAASDGNVVISLSWREDLTQQTGFLHAGVLTTIADSACGYAALSVMPESFEVVSAEFKINLLRPAVAEHFTATATVIKPGKTLVITEVVVRETESGKPIAKMMATMVPVAINNT